jgi:glycosyltransferase involved in cell wall biosynthesis
VSKPQPDGRHLLLVTPHPLDDLQRHRHGVYQRLQLLVAAAVATGMRLEVVCARGAQSPEDEAQAARQAEAQLLAHWGVQAQVLAVTRAVPQRRLPYIAQQVLACVSHRLSAAHRAALAGGQLATLRAALSRRPALVIAHRLHSMALLMQAEPRLPPCVMDLDDLEHEVQRQRAAQAQGARNKLLARAAVPALAAAVRTASRRAHHTLVCSTTDAQTLRQFAQLAPEQVIVVPNGLPLPPPLPTSPAAATHPVLLMVGTYDYEPNADGARHFLQHIWPPVQQAVPKAEVWFAGASPGCIVDPASAPSGCRLLGFVPDLEATYAQASVVIAPILTGGGTRVKLVEAALRGKPMVSTTLGAHGLGLIDGQQVRLADNPADFARACVSLLTQPDEAQRLGEAARAVAREHFDRSQIAAALAQACLKAC